MVGKSRGEERKKTAIRRKCLDTGNEKGREDLTPMERNGLNALIDAEKGNETCDTGG